MLVAELEVTRVGARTKGLRIADSSMMRCGHWKVVPRFQLVLALQAHDI